MKLHFYWEISRQLGIAQSIVSMPFRAEAPFLRRQHIVEEKFNIVSMPFRAETPFLHGEWKLSNGNWTKVSMPFRAETPFLQAMNSGKGGRINALSGWGSISTKTEISLFMVLKRDVSMPSRAGAPFLHNCKRNNIHRDLHVSMPFRAETPFLRYPFKNLGFMRFLEPVFAGIYQNILTMTIFRAC